MIEQPIGRLLALGALAFVACLISLGLIIVLRPWLQSHALARPNARSSHRKPTPQGGGFAVVTATLVVAWGALALVPGHLPGTGHLLAVTAATVVLALVGALDDIRGLPALPRLALQFIAVGGLIAALPDQLRLVPFAPWWFERCCLLIAGVWFVNLMNFMDGIDWMTVAEVVPVSAAIVLLGILDAIEAVPAHVAAALLGATLGFAPFNKPVARLFLGDVGSLPVGLLLGWLLLHVAAKGHFAAAILLPLYYLADATITLGHRVVTGAPFWQAHRSHFYQRATDGGFTVPEIIAHVAGVNLALGVLALITVAVPGLTVASLALAAGAAIVGWPLIVFARGKSGKR